MLLISFSILFLVVCLFPFFWIASTSLKTESELFDYPSTVLPKKATLKGYRKLLIDQGYYIYLKNSLIACLSSMALTLILATLIVYPITRMRVSPSLARGVLTWLLFVRLLHPIILLIPLFEIIQGAGLYDRLVSLVILYTVLQLPLAVWILRGFFQEIPLELEEAAFIDGASRPVAFFKVFLPQVAPALFVVAILVFVWTWSEFLAALILTGSLRSQTFPIGLWKLVGQFTMDWRGMSAAAVIAVAVPTGLLFAVRGYVIRGLSFGIVREKA